MDTAILRRMFDHLRWADERTLAALRAAGTLPDGVLERFHHVLAAEHVWLQRIAGRPQQVPVWPAGTLDDCTSLHARNQGEFAALFTTLDGAALEKRRDYANSQGALFSTQTVDMLLQVALHGSWHRGQIAMLMRKAGLEPAATDYILFVRAMEAAPRPPG
jgi:uncharacterized damage-inducible protein DinB